MKKSFKTKGKMFRWEAENGVGWYFVYIDSETSEQLKNTLTKNKIPRVAFGSVAVEVTVGTNVWKTSLFPSKKSKCYMLPVKASVRKSEDLYEGDTIDITLTLI